MNISIITAIGNIYTDNKNTISLEHTEAYYEYFRNIIRNKLLVMDKIAYENTCIAVGKSFGVNLYGEKIIIFSKIHNLSYVDKNKHLMQKNSVDDVILTASKMKVNELIVIGGKSTRDIFFDTANKLYIAHTPWDFYIHRYLPKFLFRDWISISRLYRDADAEIPFTVRFKIFERSNLNIREDDMIKVSNLKI